MDSLQEIIQQHAGQIAGLEKERDFYYQKLRDVEMICQEPECESLPHVQKILEILYATEVRGQITRTNACRRDIFFLRRRALLSLIKRTAMAISTNPTG